MIYGYFNPSTDNKVDKKYFRSLSRQWTRNHKNDRFSSDDPAACAESVGFRPSLSASWSVVLKAIYRLGPALLTIFMLSGSAALFLGGFARHHWYIVPVALAAAVAIRWHVMLIDTEQDRLFRYIAYAALNICALTLIVTFFMAGIMG